MPLCAIVTKYIQATNTKPARIKAYVSGDKYKRSKTVSYNYACTETNEQGNYEAHKYVAEWFVRDHFTSLANYELNGGSMEYGYAFIIQNATNYRNNPVL